MANTNTAAAIERITIYCTTGDCYEFVQYDAEDLADFGIRACLSDDGWDARLSLCPKCNAEYHGPQDAPNLLAPVENN